jgi:branched-chain amino acid transport system substrate-binding protein
MAAVCGSQEKDQFVGAGTVKLISIIVGVATCALGCAANAADLGVKIGVLTDLSGPYADLSEQGSILATRMALEDFAAVNPGLKLDLVSADHQNKPDIGSAIVRKWYDEEGVDAVVDIANSAVALAVSQLTDERNKVFLASGAATSALTGKSCAPTTVQWTYDTYALSHGTGGALVRTGGDKWFFITADYAFGHAMERDTSAFVESRGR